MINSRRMNVQWNAETQNQNCWDRGNWSYDGKSNGVRAEECFATLVVDDGLSCLRKIAAYISRVCRCRAKEINRHGHDDESKMKAQSVRQHLHFLLLQPFFFRAERHTPRHENYLDQGRRAGGSCYRHVNSCILILQHHAKNTHMIIISQALIFK